MKKSLIIGVVILVVAIIIVAFFMFSGGDYNGSKNSEEKILEVTLIDGSFAGRASIIINSRGKTDYEFDSGPFSDEPIIHKESKKISKAQFDELANLIRKNNFWLLNKEYDDGLLDAGWRIRVKSTSLDNPELEDYKYYEVSCTGGCPQEMFIIREKIVELWGGPFPFYE